MTLVPSHRTFVSHSWAESASHTFGSLSRLKDPHFSNGIQLSSLSTLEQGHLGNMSAKRRGYGNLRTRDEGGPKAAGKETCATD